VRKKKQNKSGQGESRTEKNLAHQL